MAKVQVKVEKYIEFNTNSEIFVILTQKGIELMNEYRKKHTAIGKKIVLAEDRPNIYFKTTLYEIVKISEKKPLSDIFESIKIQIEE
jgi:hypothetical protein